ncbi:MAG: hypothetical protein JRI96_12025 [Deltaproteobacteria bacterium]|nr:hypothetical protein [Deltaproteobacteria bacterium]
MKKRSEWGIRYLYIGVIFILFFIIAILGSWTGWVIGFLWCLTWSSIGIGAGLINTRNHKQDYPLHLIGYYGFVLVVVSLASFSTALYISRLPILGELKQFGSVVACKFYSLAALVGLICGFLGYKLQDLAEWLFRNK